MSLLVKPHETTRSIPSSSDHEISFLHCLLSERVASSHSWMFSHFSFHFQNWWYNPSFTVQSILGPSMYGTNVCLSWEMDWSFLCVLLVVILYYFCETLDNLVSGQNPIQYTLTFGWSCLWCLQRVETYTIMLQNFSAMNLYLCTVVQKALTGIWHRLSFCHMNVIYDNSLHCYSLSYDMSCNTWENCSPWS